MAEMEIKSIYEKLKELKVDWMKDVNKKIKLEKQKDIENQKEVREFVSENKKYLTILKNQYPVEFEQYYWDIRVCVKRNNIFQNTVYDKMLPFTALIVSILGVACGIADNYPEVSMLTTGLRFATLFGCFISVGLFGKYILSAMDTRERSYYEIMLSILEDLRNGEKNLSEKK